MDKLKTIDGMSMDNRKRKQDAGPSVPCSSKVSKAVKSVDEASSKGLALPFDHRYIVAPMVGASELPFRLLCRKYGAQLVYTPMMLAAEFANSQEYRDREFQTTPFDRPLVCHFAANTPEDFAKAAQQAEPFCDAIDLNLGCPQRTAYVGHFGSYLLDSEDRPLIVSIVEAGVRAVRIPIFCKIRLLETLDETIGLCNQLYDAGASMIAIHARYRASFARKGPGARDGPAMLDQVQKLKERFPNRLVVTNGNTITYDDVVTNLQLTGADGIMAAEGILDNPALFLGRLGSQQESTSDTSPLVEVKGGKVFEEWAKRDKWTKKMEFIKTVESKIDREGESALNRKEKKKLSKKDKLLTKLRNCSTSGSTYVSLKDLYKASHDKAQLALEYLQLVRQYPTTMRTVIFHTRRILKDELTTYQRMEECLGCKTFDDVERVVSEIGGYQRNPGSFQYDLEKAKKEKEALERKKIEEGKRKHFEERMMRKAKREGKTDIEYYLRVGAAVPTEETVCKLKLLNKEEQLQLWKDCDHSQHCMAFHIMGDCPRGRGCAFLHLESKTKNGFIEGDEVAG
jgi:tRNA-dihydrouridine synthase 1